MIFTAASKSILLERVIASKSSFVPSAIATAIFSDNSNYITTLINLIY